jgi:hypothetical protein
VEDNILKYLFQSRVYPDIESSSLSVSRSLLPVVRKLKWSFQRDRLAKMARAGSMCGMSASSDTGPLVSFAKWLEDRGRGIVEDGERVRLALCPNVRKMTAVYESIRK